MKKFLAFLMALAMLCTMTAALAEGRPAPDDLTTITTTDVIGAETTYKKYDAKFYDEASEQPGTIERVEYTTEAYGAPISSYVNVYVPYGYDENTKYNVIYFLHGTNETQESFLEDPRAKNALDNMVEVGKGEPFIMVFPTYYYDYENRAIDIPAFMNEMRNDIMPAVEGRFSTFAETCDDEGFRASRDHRAFSGYSRGSYVTWHEFFNLLDLAKWYMPFSAAISGAAEMEVPGPEYAEQVKMLTDAIEAQPGYDFFIYIGLGGPRDMMYDVVTGLAAEMVKCDAFSYGSDPSANNLYMTISKEIHQTLMARYYLYNAFDILFK